MDAVRSSLAFSNAVLCEFPHDHSLSFTSSVYSGAKSEAMQVWEELAVVIDKT